LQDHLSAIDILAACNLVNYFGKAVLGGNGVGQISMYPVLLQKVVSLREMNGVSCWSFLLKCESIAFCAFTMCLLFGIFL
jgi:hypothetical protein